MTDETESNGEVEITSIAPAPQSHFAEACLQEIRDAEKEVAEAELAHIRAKEAAKGAKEFWEAKVEELRRVIRASTEELPLFDRPAKTADPGDDEAWRGLLVADLHLPDSIVTALLEADIASLGDLSDYQSAGKDLIDIKGIGESKADQIRDALEKFWAERAKTKPERPGGPWQQPDVDANAGSDEAEAETPTGAPVPPGEPISPQERERVNPSKPKRSSKRSSPKRKAASRR